MTLPSRRYPRYWTDPATGLAAWIWWTDYRLHIEHSDGGGWHTCTPEDTVLWRFGVDGMVRSHLLNKSGHGEAGAGLLSGTYHGAGIESRTPGGPSVLTDEESRLLVASGLIELMTAAWGALTEAVHAERGQTVVTHPDAWERMWRAQPPHQAVVAYLHACWAVDELRSQLRDPR